MEGKVNSCGGGAGSTSSAAKSSTPGSQLQACGCTALARCFGWPLSMSTSLSAWRARSRPRAFWSVRKFTKRMHDMKTTGSLQRKGVKKYCRLYCKGIGREGTGQSGRRETSPVSHYKNVANACSEKSVAKQRLHAQATWLHAKSKHQKSSISPRHFSQNTKSLPY